MILEYFKNIKNEANEANEFIRNLLENTDVFNGNIVSSSIDKDILTGLNTGHDEDGNATTAYSNAIEKLASSYKKATAEATALELAEKGLSKSTIEAVLATQGWSDAEQQAALDSDRLKEILDAASDSIRTNTGVTVANTVAQKAWAIATNLVKAAWSTLLPVLISMGVSFILNKVVPYLREKFFPTLDDLKDKLQETKNEYNEIASELDSVNRELETTNSRMKELESRKGALSFVEQAEYENLVKTNNELERQKVLLEDEERRKAKEKNKAFVKTMDKDIGKDGEYKTLFDGTMKKGHSSTDSTRATEEEYIQYQFEEREKLLDDLRNAETEKEKERIQKQIDKIDKYLEGKKEEFLTSSDEISYVDNATDEDDIATNEYLDYIADFRDRLAIAMAEDPAIKSKLQQNAFARLIDDERYSDTVQKLKDLGEQGKVTAEDLNDPNYKEFIDKLVEIGVIDSADNLDLVAQGFNKVAEAAIEASSSVSKFKEVNEFKSGLDSIYETYENNKGKLSQDEVASILEENPEYIYYLTKVEGQYKLNKQALEDWKEADVEQKAHIENMMGENTYLENYDNLLDNISNNASHGENGGTGGVISESLLDGLIEKNKELNKSFLDGKISAKEYFDSLSNSITDCGLDTALESLNGEFDKTTDYIEEVTSVLSTEISDAMLQANKRFLKGETSVADYIEEIKAGSKAQQKLLKSTYGLTENNEGYIDSIEGADEATQSAVDSYNDLVDSQKELEQVSGFVDVLSENAAFLEAYTDTAGNLMDSIFDDSRFSSYINSLSDQLYNFAMLSTENLNSVAQALVNTTGISTEQALNIVNQGSSAIQSAMGNSLASIQGMTNYAMSNVSGAITNTSSAIGSVLTALGNAIKNFKYKITATPYMEGSLDFSVDKNGINLQLPTFGFEIEGSGGASVSKFASALSNAGSYFSNAGAAQAASQAMNIGSYLPSGTGSGSTASGYRPTYTGSGGSGGSGGDSGSEEFSETLDWIEVQIQEVERQIDNLDKIVSATYKSWTDRNNALADEISKVSSLIDAQNQAYKRYMKEADSVGLSDKYKKLVQEGKIDIETIKDEDLADKIKSYTEWYDKAIEAKDAVQDLQDQLAELAKTSFDNVVTQYEEKLSFIDHEVSVLEAYIDQVETKGHAVSKSYYEELLKVEQNNLATLRSEYSSLQTALKKAMSDGSIEEYSSDWYDMMGQINDVEVAIIESNTALVEFQKNIRDLEWESFDRLEDMISQITDEADFLIDLMSDEDLFDENGNMTDHGKATLGLHAVKYDTYMEQAKDYADEIAEIDKDLANDPYNIELLERREELLQSHRDMISAAEDEKQSMIDLASEGYDKMLEYLDELINKRKELLQETKDLYDYEKNVREQTEEIARLEKIGQALAGDTSEEGQLRAQQNATSLEEAREALEKTEYDKYLSDQEKMLDELASEAEQWVNERLDNVDQLLSDIITSTNENSETIKTTLETETRNVGTQLSDKMSAIWASGGSANSVVSTYSQGISDKVTGVISVLGRIESYISAMNKASEKEAKADIKGTSSNSPTASSGGSSSSSNSNNNSNSNSNSSNSNNSNTTSNSKWGSWFISKKNNVSKSKLNIDTSIVDRLKYNDFDSSFTARAKYYSAMGLGSSSSYTGSANQNRAMIKAMRENGFHTGGLIGSAIKASGEDGIVLAKAGEYILTSEQFEKLSQTIATAQPFIDTVRKLPKLHLNSAGNNTIENNVEMNIAMHGVQDVQGLVNELQRDNRFQKIVQQMTIGKIAGSNGLSKYKY